MIEYVILGVCLLAFILAAVNYYSVYRMDTGTKKMKEISDYIAQGAYAFLKAEYKIMSIVIVVVAVLIFFFLDIKSTPHNEGMFTAISFVSGAIASIISGAIGMFVATKANVRTTQAARKSVADGFNVAFKGGSVLGLSLVAFTVFGLIVL